MRAHQRTVLTPNDKCYNVNVQVRNRMLNDDGVRSGRGQGKNVIRSMKERVEGVSKVCAIMKSKCVERIACSWPLHHIMSVERRIVKDVE